MFSVCEYGIRHHDLNITELYDITNIYYKTFSHDLKDHNNCICKKTFPHNNNNNDPLYTYLLTHYEKINIINN